MSIDKPILVKLNPIGYKIECSEIDRLLDAENNSVNCEREWIASFFDIFPGELTKKLLTRYAKACEVMTNISVGSHDEDIHIKLINTMAGAKRCFSYGEFLACIELCALRGEMLANFLCIVHKEAIKVDLVINALSKKAKDSVRQCLEKDNFYDGLNQMYRVEWMITGKIILEKYEKDLIEIHKLRIKYFHHWDQSHDDIENDALTLRSVLQ